MTQYKLVPVEPTPEMIEAGFGAMVSAEYVYTVRDAYRAMLDAAAEAPQAQDAERCPSYVNEEGHRVWVVRKDTERDGYYLQDKRAFVGNDVLWWAKDGNGYTTDLRLAQVFTKDEAEAQHRMRSTDIPWPASYIDSKARPAVDFQHIVGEEADATLQAKEQRNDDQIN